MCHVLTWAKRSRMDSSCSVFGTRWGIKLYEYGTDISGFSKLAYENDVTCFENYVTYLYGTWVKFVSQTKKSLWS